jgi:hypothetical protein
MLLRSFLQVECGLARRQITLLIDQGKVFVNQKIVESYKSELYEGDCVQIPSLEIDKVFHFGEVNVDKDSALVLFNKPK